VVEQGTNKNLTRISPILGAGGSGLLPQGPGHDVPRSLLLQQTDHSVPENVAKAIVATIGDCTPGIDVFITRKILSKIVPT
jgi:hypothetical protein